MTYIIIIFVAVFSAVILTLVMQSVGRKKFRQQVDVSGFTVTKRAGTLCVDENNKKWWVEQDGGVPTFHDYNEILDFELIVDGEKFKSKGGVSRAIAGGILFGGVGAIVGASTAKRQSTITKMYMTIILKGGNIERVSFIESETKVDSWIYNVAKDSAEQADAILTNIMYESSNPTAEPASPVASQIETTTNTNDNTVNNAQETEKTDISEQTKLQFDQRYGARNGLYNLDHSNTNFHSVLTADGGYDFTMLTDDERNYIEEKLNEAEHKYSEPYSAIGLCFVSASTVYKPGYILPQIVILKYGDSEKPLDLLAVAIAYSKKGAYFRKRAIEYFEKYYANPVPAKIPNEEHPLFDERNLKLTLADLYEKEYELEKAFSILRNYYKTTTKKDEVVVDRIGQILVKIDINKAVSYYETAMSEYPGYYAIQSAYEKALEKQQKGYVYKPRKSKPKESDLLINEQIEALARQFV